ncbi:MAG: DJ-1/PfpI family protein [Clostridia bacterium]|nr:DJ-1/PfpI family protein [Clostridia bacterium]
MVYVFLADGFEEIEALAPVDILRRAKIDVKTVSINDTLSVTGAHGITVQADILLKDVSEDSQMLVLPGGMPGTLNLQKCQPLCDMLKKAEGFVAAICAAPSVLGGLGLLKGKKATCYPGFEDKLDGAEYVDESVVVSGKVITSKGAGTAHLFGFTLLSLLKEENEAEKLRKTMMYE